MGALDGVRVLEVGGFISGPFAGALLGDLGADVVKLEPPNGDPFRHWSGGLYSPHYQAFNRNKRSIALDLQTTKGLESLRGLAERMDVIVQNLRPATARRLGLTYETLRERNPGIIVCGLSAFGEWGPDSDGPGFDTMGQAVSGLMSLFSDPDDPRPSGPALADQLAGIFGAYGVLAALMQRRTTGRGQQVSTSLLASGLAFSAQPLLSSLATGKNPTRYTRAAGSQSFAFLCWDDEALAIHLSSPEKFWRGLVAAVRDESLLADPRFASREDRVRNYEDLYAALKAIFVQNTRSHWLVELQKNDVPCAPVNKLLQVPEHPQVQALRLIGRVSHPLAGESVQVWNPVMGETQRTQYLAPPLLDEQGADILAEFLGEEKSQGD